MAHKFSPKKLGCKITDIQPDKMHPGRMLVAVEFDDGSGDPWHQAFSVIPDEVITVDDFLAKLYTMDIKRPVDPYQNLKQALKEGETFVLNLTARIEKPEDNLIT